MNAIELFRKESTRKRFEEVLGERAPQFIVSVLSLVNASHQLMEADPETIYGAAMTAAALDLPVNSNLGYAYIIPYRTKLGNQAQFQIGYKGLIQLALRSGQYRVINSTDVREGEIVERNRITGVIKFAWLAEDERNSKPIIGYASYFELLSGFSSTLYMSVNEIKEHASNYSAMAKRNEGIWISDFDVMARKTVLKLNLSRYGLLTVQMEKAIVNDQAVIRNDKIIYVDNSDTAKDEKLAIAAD
ncbi:MAG TPA: recombinase RecT, partial [Tenuifilaceae bacterium]|nr:recombinase RecT [Tenuifilaceae bacterium]